MDRRHAIDLGLLAVAVTAISTAAPLIRVAAAPALAVAFWRVALAVPVTGLGVAVGHRTEVRELDRRTWKLSAVGGLLLAGHFGLWVPSLSFTSVASSVALVSTMPVWAAVFARLRGEVVTRRVWRGIGLALLGVVLLTGVDLTVSVRALFGDVLALAGGMLAALYVTVGAQARRRASTAVYVTLCYTVGAVLLLAVSLVTRQSITGYSAGTWLALTALMVGPQLLGHTVMNQVLRTLSPTVVSVAILFEIVGAALLAWAAFGEVPPPTAVPAAGLIVAGIVVVLTDPAGRPVPAPTP